MTTDSGGIIQVRNNGGGRWRDDTVVARVAAVIGQVEGDPEYLFGNVTAVHADHGGRVYVADRIGSSVRTYAPDGTFLAWLGREGEGPGEYTWPTALLADRADDLWVRDINRFTHLSRDNPNALPDRVIGTIRLPGYGNTKSRRSRIDTAGVLLYPASLFRLDAPPQFFYLRNLAGAWLDDTLHVPRFAHLDGHESAWVRTSEHGGRMFAGLSVAPFEPLASWDVTARGTVMGSDGETYSIVEVDLRGDTIRVVHRTDYAIPVPEGEYQDSLAALRALIDSLPVPVSRVLRASPLVLSMQPPRVYPAVLDLTVGTGDWIWVRRWPTSASTQFDVFDAEGFYLGHVLVPVALLPDPPPFYGEGTIVGVIRDADTDVERVVTLVFEIPPLEEVGR